MRGCLLSAVSRAVFFRGLVSIFLFPFTLLATDIAWTGAAGDGLWTTGTNWSTGSVPTSLDDVVIGPDSGEVVLSGARNVRSLVLDGTVWVRGQGATATLTVETELLNRGTIRLESAGSNWMSRIVAANGGVVINEGTITAAAGSGGSRAIIGSVVNRGTIHAAGGTVFTIGSTGDVITQEGVGLLDGAGRLAIGGLLDLTGGECRGEVVVDNGSLRVGTGLAPQTVITRGAVSLLQQDSPGVTVWVRGEGATATLNVPDGLVNHGTIRLESAGANWTSQIVAASGGTFTNAGIVVANAGSGGGRAISGNLINRGTIAAGEGRVFELGQSNDWIVFEDGKLDGNVIIAGGLLRIGSRLPAQTIPVTGSATLLELDNPDVAVWLRSEGASRTLTVPDGFTNRGTIRLSSSGNIWGATLRVADGGTLLNEGTIVAERGTHGGNRTISGSVVNRGAIRADANSGISLGGAGAVLVQEDGSIGGFGGIAAFTTGRVELTGGLLGPVFELRGGELTVAGSAPAQTIPVTGSATLAELDNPDVAVWLRSEGASRTLTVPDGFTNRGTIRLSSSGNIWGATLRVADGGTLQNEGTIVTERGTHGGNRTISGSVVNRGTIRAGANSGISIGGAGAVLIQEDGSIGGFGGIAAFTTGRVELTGGLLGPVFELRGGELTVAASAPAQTIPVTGSATLLNLDNPDVEVWLRSEGTSRTLTVPDGFTNRGTIQLSSSGNAWGATLRVADSGTLQNEGTIVAERGTHGGNRTISGSVVNRGTIRAREGVSTLTLGLSGAEHRNEGALVAEGGSIAFSGTSLVNADNGLIGGVGSINLASIVLRQEGTIAPGLPDEIGTLAFSGTAVFEPSSRFRVRLATVEAETKMDRITFSGTVTLNGTFEIAPESAFPDVGAIFEPLAGGAVNAAFAEYSGLQIEGNLALSPNYSPTALRLEVVAADTGDGPIVAETAFGGNAVLLRFFDGFGIDPSSAGDRNHYRLTRLTGGVPVAISNAILAISYEGSTRWTTVLLEPDGLVPGIYALTVSDVRNSLGTPMTEPFTLTFAPDDVLPGIRSWSGKGKAGDWHDPANWFGSRVPGEDEEARIPAGAGTVIVSKNAAVGRLTASSPVVLKQGTFAVTAGASLLTAGLIIESAAGLHVSGNDVSFTAIGETVFNGGEILATEGSVVRLPDLIVLHGQGQAAARNRLEADGPGSLISLPQATALFSPSAPFAVRAIRGGQLLMENLDTIEGRVEARATGPGSLLDWSRLENWDSGDFTGSLTMEDNGRAFVGDAISRTRFRRVDVTFAGDGEMGTGHLEMDTAGELTGRGTVAGNLTVGRLELARPFADAPPDRLTVAGDLNLLPEAEVGIFAYDTGTGAIEVTGIARLDGELEFNRVNLVPHVGDEYQIFQYGSATGGFGEWRGLDAGDGVEYLPEYGTKALVLRGAEATPPAVVEAVPAGAIDRFSTFVVSFNKALSNSSVGSNDFQLATRAGNISASSVTRIAPERYRLRFPEQEIEGVYELTIGPAIEDAAGNAMAAAHVHTVTIAKPPLPDIAVGGVAAPALIAAGEPVTVSWTITNAGTAPLIGSWTETVSIQSMDTDENVALDVLWIENQTLAIGQSVERDVSIALPFAVPHGSIRFVVEADREGSIHELFEHNNSAAALESSQLPPALGLASSVTDLMETNPSGRLPVRLTRTGSLNEALTVQLESSDTTEASVPETVRFSPRQRSIQFFVTAIHDNVVDQNQPVTITASASGYESARLDLTVIDADRPKLTITLDRDGLVDGESTGGRVVTNVPSDGPRTVQLSSSRPGRLNLPPFIVIPANETEAAFMARATQSGSLRGDTDVEITASLDNHTAGTATVFVVDPNVPVLSVELRETTLRSKSDGAGTVLTVTRTGRAVALDVRIENPRPDLVRLPDMVSLGHGVHSVTVPLTVAAGILDTGSVEVQLQASAGPAAAPLVRSDPVFLTVVSEQTPHLVLSLSPRSTAPGVAEASRATVFRSPVTNEPLTVDIGSSDPGRVALPAAIVIPAHQASAEFWIETLPRDAAESPVTVSVNVLATDHVPAAEALAVSGVAAPDLAVTDVAMPSAGWTDASVTVSYRVVNEGLSPAVGPFYQRIFLTDDPSQPFQYLLAQHTFDGSLAPRAEISREEIVRLPLREGDYHIYVQADATGVLRELRTDNNLGGNFVPITVNAAYTATVEAEFDVAPAGTPVPLRGSAAFVSDGQPAAHVPVQVRIQRGGLERAVEFTTNAAGEFEGKWQPLPNEAGIYALSASHPGAKPAGAQSEFRLLGLQLDPPELSVRLIQGGPPEVRMVTLKNPSNVPLTFLTASVNTGGGPVSIDARFPSGNEIPASGSVEAEIEVRAVGTASGRGTVEITFAAADGSSAVLPVKYESIRPNPKLVAQPGKLEESVVRGAPVFAQIMIVNDGGGTSGPIEILSSPLPWLTVPVTDAPALAPGESTLVTVQIHPPEDADLVPYTGELIARDTTGGEFVRIPFEFRVLSSDAAAVTVIAENEFTYFAAGQPRLSGASVRLYEYSTGELAAAGTTGHDGRLHLTGLTSGYYQIEVAAEKHHDFRDTIFLSAGPDNEAVVFLNYEAVRYIWDVTEIEIEDRYEITITTEFETHVPIPVVTVDPPVVDLTRFSSDTESLQIDYTVTNHGFIAAEEASFVIPEIPGYQVELLSGELGEIGALESVVVPVRYSRNGLSPLSRIAAASAAPGTCQAVAKVRYRYRCGPFGMSRSAQTMVVYQGCEGTPGVPAVTETERGPGGLGDPGGGGSSGGTVGSWLRDRVAWVLSRAGIPVAFGPREVTPRTIAAGPRGNCGETIDLGLPPCAGLTPGLGPLLGALGTAQTAYNCFIAGHLPSCGGFVPLPPVGECVGDLLGIGVPDLIESALSAMNSPFVHLAAFPGQTGDALRDALDRVVVVETWFAYLFGGTQWRNGDREIYVNWIDVFAAASSETGPDGAMVNENERAVLLDMVYPQGIEVADVDRFIDRWNRTFEYYDVGIRTAADVPSGMSTDFIDAEILDTLADNVHAAILDSQARGFSDPYSEFAFHLERYLRERPDAVCAKVKMRITQDAVLTRTAFEARLALENDSGGTLEDVSVDVAIYDATGARRDDLFGIQAMHTEPLNGVSPEGGLPAGSTAAGEWRIVPSLDATPTDEPAVYRVGGAIHYTIDGAPVTLPILPAEIRVYPQPELVLNYYHERDVYADDPFTSSVEPSIPFSLGVLVSNRGHGSARNLTIISGQPKIVENDKGLAVDFEIVATESAGVPAERNLTAEFGPLEPGETKSAIWWLTSTLQGKFIDYEATVAHLDGWDDLRLSLIQDVSIHETLGIARDLRPGSGERLGFLVSDRFPIAPRPAEIHWVHGEIEPVSFVGDVQTIGSPGPANLSVTVELNPVAGWMYSRFGDPSGGELKLISVKRSDGREIPLGENAWVTDRTFRGLGLSPIPETIIHLVDHDSTGQYTLLYASDRFDDTTPPSSTVTALPDENYERFVVEWTGIDAEGIVSFDIYVSEDGEPFSLWKKETTGRSAIFYGELGKSYAFYSVARDAAGNVEATPSGGQAATAVTRQNQPPEMEPIPNQIVEEGQRFQVTAVAHDVDAADQSVTFSLGANAPAGMSIDSQTGVLSWKTGENDGGTTRQIVVRATDNGYPPLTAEQTFQLTVLEVNRAPVIAPIANRNVHQDEVISFTVQATDPDLPSNQIAYNLAASAPVGAAIDATAGLFSWTPSREIVPGAYAITVQAADDGEPPLSAERTFTISVLPFRAELRIVIEETPVSWTEGDPPVRLAAGAEVIVGEELEFGGGEISAMFLDGGTNGDRLVMLPGPSGGALYTMENETLFRDGLFIGSVQGGVGPGEPLRLTIETSLTDASAVAEILGRIAFENDHRYPPDQARVIELSVRDSEGRNATALRTVSVTPVNFAPRIVASPILSTTADRDISFPVSVLKSSATDPDGDALAVTLPSPNGDNGGVLQHRDDTVNYTPAAAFTGWEHFTYRLSDPFGASVDGEARVWVRAIDDPAAIIFWYDEENSLLAAGLPGLEFRVEWSADGIAWHPLNTVRLSGHGGARLSGLPPGSEELAFRLALVSDPKIEIVESRPIRLRAIGSPDQPYRIEASADLIHWNTIEEGTLAPHGVIELPDPASGEAGRRFYRLVY